MKSLRHAGRPVLLAESKSRGTWRLADGSAMLDLSGGPLLQSLSHLPEPPSRIFRTVSGPGGVETELRERLEVDIQRRAGEACGGVLWAASGSDAVELALWAVQPLDAPTAHYVVREGAYHGNTFLTRWLSTRTGLANQGPEQSVRTVLADDATDMNGGEPTLLDQLIVARPGDNAVVVLETVATTGSVFWPGISCYQELLTWCRRRNIHVVLDEVAAGAFRHGWFSAFDWVEGPGPSAVVLAKGLTCGVHPLSCVLLSRDLADRLRRTNMRPPAFTYGLSDPAAWWATQCLNEFDRLRADGRFGERRRLVERHSAQLRALHLPIRVETTNTTIRLAFEDETMSARFRLALRERHMVAYETTSVLRGRTFAFFLICPPLDLELELAEAALTGVVDAARAAA